MLTSTRTARRRRRILDRAAAAREMTPAELPLKRKVTHAICRVANPTCVCASNPGKPACQRMEEAAGHIIALIKATDFNPT
jgi:hypothetical protein